jgi:diguanylate cyclase (GGDEF)-like protein
VSGRVAALIAWLAPRAPESIRAELELQQLTRIRAHLPLLYVIASLNMLIVMGVCWRAGIDVAHYGWLGSFVVLAVIRSVMWTRTKRVALAPGDVSKVLRRSVAIGVVSLAVLSAFATYTFVADLFGGSTLIPTSLAFGSLSIAFCLATLRPSAIAALAVGIVPCSVAMLAVGPFDAKILGLSYLSVAVLMTRFVGSQYDLLAKELLLQREVYDLANTDLLTGLPNRRAIMASMEQERARGSAHTFAVVLLDLDGFKGVNDTLGHLAGDELLRVVAQRMKQACIAPDATAGRLGGDEFLVILRPVHGVLDVKTRADALLHALCGPTVIDNEQVHVRSSLGTATFPNDGTTNAALLAAADAALYADKRSRAAAHVAAVSASSEERRRHRAQ